MQRPHFPKANNEKVLSYAPHSAERLALQQALDHLRKKPQEIPQYIGGERIIGQTRQNFGPHQLKEPLAIYSYGSKATAAQAIEAALKAKAAWARMPYYERAMIFYKAADLLSGPYRYLINAATMLGQGKNAYQAEIDSACELADFWRFNIQFMDQIYRDQPLSSPGVFNQVEYRPLEGFVTAFTPFNFTAIAGNLPTAPALLGNTIVWKPAETQILSAHFIMKILLEAGLPAGVINLITGPSAELADTLIQHPSLAGVHFTGSTGVFEGLWQKISLNLRQYRSYPRLVGETGAKNFLLMHPSADVAATVTAFIRGAFEYQGQKCSATSRMYIPQSRWSEVKTLAVKWLKEIKVGPVWDFANFVNPVIDAKAFDSISAYLEFAKKDSECEILFGGNAHKEQGFYIEPTFVLTSNPLNRLMKEEIFGPVICAYVYPDEKFEETLELIDSTAEYGLTGAIMSQDRAAILKAHDVLKDVAGNFYVNDKSTGAVVGQQPFGGARKSGTNDKAGSMQNLLRWTSARTVKETFVSAIHYAYPFMQS